ncbi:MAG: PP2C family protein-serine/threonine phosphatase [Ignavibacteriaceae bacterium]
MAVLVFQDLQIYYGFMLICILFIYEIYSLFRFVDKTNTELARFLNSVKYSDTSQTFISKNFGKSFDELFSVFRNLTSNISESKSEQEVGHLYLQTIVKHIGIGLITYRKDGEVELINNAAKKLLNVQSLKNIYNLGANNRELLGTLSTIKAGDKTLVKVEGKGEGKVLSIFAAEFKLRDREFTLVSLQDIKNELERERLSSELEIAHEVQTKLLPDRIPVVAGYSFAAICEPAKEVGGDYYDFTMIDEDKIGLVIGDVTGKGLPAAIYMTLIKGIFQSYSENNSSAAEVLIKINKLVYQIMQNGLFVTMLYGILDVKNNKFTFARAGHELPLIYKFSDRSARSIKTIGMALGFEKGDVFTTSIEEKTINIEKGDTIVLYTDGVTEANNRLTEEYGLARMQDFLKENGNLSSTKLLDLFYEDVKNFCLGTEQFDDMTVVIVQRVSDN